MNKTRIYELAKELDISSKDLVNIAIGMNIDVHNHMSSLENDEVAKLRSHYTQKNEPVQGNSKVNRTEPSKPEEHKSALASTAQPAKPTAPQTSRPASAQPNRPANQQNAQQNRPNQGGTPGQKPPTKELKPNLNHLRPNNNQPRPANQTRPENQSRPVNSSINAAESKKDSIQELDEDNVRVVSNKEEIKKVERIGKKPQNNRPPFRPQHKNNRNFRSKDAPVVKREEIVSKKPIKIGEFVSVKELGEKLGKQANEIIKKLMLLGVMATINQELDFDTASLIISEYGIQVEKLIDRGSEEVLLKEEEDKPEELKARPPVVTIMGHVDHGKTSLLDAVRQTNVIATEAGGITQHIGAYTVTIDGKKICFLDTPGHEAFTAMRARGANVTDIVILVVAADDGVMPQTVEAINHAKAANVAIIVAVNKIDKPGANPDKVKQELTEYGLVSEEWGGETIFCPVSAKKKEGIDNLLEMVLLVAEMQEMKANPDKKAKGTVIEAELDKSKGPVATVLVQEGTLNIGDAFIVGNTLGKIRAMVDDKGRRVKKAGPSTPVEIIGLSEVPSAGDIFNVVEDEKVAKQISEKRREKQRQAQFQSGPKISLDELFSQIQEGKVKELNIIVKADVQGSVEAIKQSLERLSNSEVKVRAIHGGVGAITETDVMLASASNAIIIGFNVRPQISATAMAERDKVDIRLYRVIYNAIDDIEAAMKGMLDPEYKEVVTGHAEIRMIIKVSTVGSIAGCYVTDGKINRNNDVRLIRNGIVIHEGKLASLKRFKDDVKEVNSGYECGLNIDKFNDIKEGDIVESYIMEMIPRK